MAGWVEKLFDSVRASGWDTPRSSASAALLVRFAAENGVEFDGFSDHGVSEALYFSDPDGNGLEFYADRPREQWPFQNGELAMTTRPRRLGRSRTIGGRMLRRVPG